MNNDLMSKLRDRHEDGTPQYLKITATLSAAIIAISFFVIEMSVHHPILDRAAAKYSRALRGLASTLTGNPDASAALASAAPTGGRIFLPRFGFPQVLVGLLALALLAAVVFREFRHLSKLGGALFWMTLAVYFWFMIKVNRKLGKLAEVLREDRPFWVVSPHWIVVFLAACAAAYCATTLFDLDKRREDGNTGIIG